MVDIQPYRQYILNRLRGMATSNIKSRLILNETDRRYSEELKKAREEHEKELQRRKDERRRERKRILFVETDEEYVAVRARIEEKEPERNDLGIEDDGGHFVPTPEQIAERAAEIRKEWSPSVERQRRVTSAVYWTLPEHVVKRGNGRDVDQY